jgi:hypothetical protein
VCRNIGPCAEFDLVARLLKLRASLHTELSLRLAVALVTTQLADRFETNHSPKTLYNDRGFPLDGGKSQSSPLSKTASQARSGGTALGYCSRKLASLSGDSLTLTSPRLCGWWARRADSASKSFDWIDEGRIGVF